MELHYKVFRWAKTQKKSPTIQSTYDSCAGLRYHFLEILSMYDSAKKNTSWTQYIRVIYNKLVNIYIPLLDKTIIQKSPGTVLRMNYDCYTKNEELIAFKKNCLKLKKKCEESTINYYNYLPGSILPLNIRTKIINYISPVPM